MEFLIDDKEFARYVKPLPDYLNKGMDKSIAEYIRNDIAMTATASTLAQKALTEATAKLFEATRGGRKYVVLIATPSYRDTPRYIDDLVWSLKNRGITGIKANTIRGTVETPHVIVKMISPAMCRDGLFCDECFGFSMEESMSLKRSPIPGISELTKVPPYIEAIEKETTVKAMKQALNSIYGASGIAKSATKPEIVNVIFNDPATIVMWSDGTKTVVKAENESFDPEKGLAMAISKKNLGNNYDYYITFKRWLKKYYKDHPEKDVEWTVAAKPVEKAYQTLVNIMSTKGTKLNTKPALEEAIEEAIGLLGEALKE